MLTAEMMGKPAELGAMGIHYFRPDLLGVTAVPHVRVRPEILGGVIAFNLETGLWLLAGTCAIVGPLGLGVIALPFTEL